MRHSKRPSCSPVNYHPSPRFLACSPLSYQLSPRSGASGYQNRVHKNHEYLIACPVCLQPHAFLSDRLITWGSTARPLPPPLLFTFHLTPALAQRGTLPKPSARTLANWQPALGATRTPLLSAKPATVWQTAHPTQIRGLLSDRLPAASKSAVCSDSLPSCPLAPSITRSLAPSRSRPAPALLADLDPLIPGSLDPLLPLPLTAPARRDKVLNSRVTAAGSGAVELRCGLNLKTRARDVPGL